MDFLRQKLRRTIAGSGRPKVYSTHFRDDAGRRWSFRWDADAIARAHACGIDVRRLTTEADWERLYQTHDGRRQASTMMFCLIEPLADRRGVSPEDFTESLRKSWPDAFLAMAAAWSKLEELSLKKFRKLFRHVAGK
jgi:hypothetical protein